MPSPVLAETKQSKSAEGADSSNLLKTNKCFFLPNNDLSSDIDPSVFLSSTTKTTSVSTSSAFDSSTPRDSIKSLASLIPAESTSSKLTLL